MPPPVSHTRPVAVAAYARGRGGVVQGGPGARADSDDAGGALVAWLPRKEEWQDDEVLSDAVDGLSHVNLLGQQRALSTCTREEQIAR